MFSSQLITPLYNSSVKCPRQVIFTLKPPCPYKEVHGAKQTGSPNNNHVLQWGTIKCPWGECQLSDIRTYMHKAKHTFALNTYIHTGSLTTKV